MSLVLESADARDFRLSLNDIANLPEQLAVVQYKWDPSDSASIQKKVCATFTTLVCLFGRRNMCLLSCRRLSVYFFLYDHDFVMHVHGFVS
jgi:hypothetical protein